MKILMWLKKKEKYQVVKEWKNNAIKEKICKKKNGNKKR